MQLEKLQGLMSNDRSSDNQWTEPEELDDFSEILEEKYIPWAIIVSIALSILMAAVALILIVRQHLQISTLMP